MRVRRSIVKETAARVLTQFNVTSAPVDVESIAKGLGAVVVNQEEEKTGEPISGFFMKHGKQLVIGINSSESSVRQRFTLGHELGHMLLHDRDYVLDSDVVYRNRSKISDGTDRDEVEANLFAAELLMPEFLLEKELAKYPAAVNEDQIGDIAKKFKVSAPAMTIRLAHLGMLE